jgi:hypothetical protein
MKSQRNPREKSFPLLTSPCIPFIGRNTEKLIRARSVTPYQTQNQFINPAIFSIPNAELGPECTVPDSFSGNLGWVRTNCYYDTDNWWRTDRCSDAT